MHLTIGYVGYFLAIGSFGNAISFRGRFGTVVVFDEGGEDDLYVSGGGVV